VGDRLLLNANSAVFQSYHGENKISMKWWWGLLCTRPKWLVEFLFTETTVRG
jgi:hypothetical protein